MVKREERKQKLEVAMAELQRGLRASRQGAYERRLPAPEAVPHLDAARAMLRELAASEPPDPAVFLLLSQAEEAFLSYTAAIELVRKAVEAGHRLDKRGLKRLAGLREHEARWKDLRLTPKQLSDLGRFLRAAGVTEKNCSFEYTKTWLVNAGVEQPDAVMAALERRGAFSDFQVLANVVIG